MSEQPITLSVLARFHREVLLPDVERIVGNAVDGLRDEIHALHDSLRVKFERLETEYQAIKAGVGVDGLQAQVDALERRLPASSS